ncbi:Abi family protein [Coraliomargarita sinensis]|uniref:Abi family protein n=1 Tax=Coraliomargarita sinensis TaxID=2174842 RepID=UPI001304C99B|nr:Abi family protein [Coraliomargarita sinensis]
MEYLKESLRSEEQAQRLLDRGLKADREELIKRLSSVSYYRLSGYLYPFRKTDSDNYVEGATLKVIWDRYCFDRRLRVLLLDAIERVEVAIRTQLTYHFSEKHGAFGHCDERHFPNLKIVDYIEWRENLIVETSRSKEAFKQHFFKKYGDSHRNLPVWMASELMSMGSLLTMLKGVDSGIQSKVSSHFGMADELLLSWLRSLYAARNVCAHHSRLWNRVLGYAPSLPQRNKYPNWHITDATGKRVLVNNRVGILLMICHNFLKQISPTSQWRKRTEELFAEYPEIPVKAMGLPAEWTKHPLWT